MRRYLVAGNWKLNMGPAAGVELATGIANQLAGQDLGGDVLVCPPFVTLPAVTAALAKLAGSPVQVGAQNCADQAEGAFTGEISPALLEEVGARFVIIAHSERRQYQRESDDQFVRKVDLVHAAGLTAIFCFGELLDDRKSGRAEQVVRAQLEGVLPRLQHANPYNTVLAYEPVWAIGTGETATAEIAQQMHAFTRGVVGDLMGQEVASYTRILYGGSCKPSNAAELIGLPDVDGGLIGGASLKATDFVGIVKAAETTLV